MKGNQVRAVVGSICKGRASPFVVTYQEKGLLDYPIPQEQSITFSLNPSCWKGDRKPEKGQVVLLENVEQYAKGWRAKIARPLNLETRKEQQHEAGSI